MTPALPRIARYFNRWRLALLIFLLVFTTFLLLDLDSGAVLWDEPPHLVDGLLLHRGLFQKYAIEGSRYPPLFDVITALYFKIFGLSVLSARLVAVTFGVLSVWCVFEFAYRFYGPRNALISSVFLATMPGLIWLSRIALLETMLLFFFSISMLSFFVWMQTKSNKMLLLSVVTLGLGFIVKYQALFGGVVMFVSILLLERERVRAKIGNFWFMLIVAGAVVLPLLLLAYLLYVGGGHLESWLYVILVGNEETFVYSKRFPFPIFYFIEMTYPYSDVHPILLPIYIFALFGLGLWLWRRRREDKFSLIWFFVIYVIFEMIPAKSWRYITLVFPILAVSASDFLLSIWDKFKDNLSKHQMRFRKINLTKVATVFLIYVVLLLGIFSSFDAYIWVKGSQVYIPAEEASRYVAERSELNETVAVLCTGNFFSPDLIKFYLQVNNPDLNPPWTYPDDPVDAFVPTFNVTSLIEQSTALNVTYLMLFELGNNTFFQSELTSQKVLDMMLDTNSFLVEKEFGSFPRRIFIIKFSPNLLADIKELQNDAQTQ